MELQCNLNNLKSRFSDEKIDKLPFKLQATLNDENCWYCSVSDQIILQDLSDFSRDHASLRKLVVQKMPSFHQFKEWKSQVEETGEAMEDFLK